MSDADRTESIEEDLTELIMNCPELSQLEAQLAQFNIFRVLRADRNELRHSNMLAWLFDPEGAHGLGDLFLRRWLMAVLHGAASLDQRPEGWISPVAVDVLGIDRVEVHREFEHIDLLFTIRLKGERTWVVCIENKVDSRQGKGQLQRYYEIVERRFSRAERRLYVFLTRHQEASVHEAYIDFSYEELAQVLALCLAQRKDEIGGEPQLLIAHYLQLLRDDFMEESEASILAREIYLRHRQALDFIFENKVDPVFEATNALEKALCDNRERLGIVMDRTNKGWVRFVPNDWDIAQNRGGTGWGTDSRFLLCEVSLWSKTAELHVTAGEAPDAWVDRLWDRAAKPPFKRDRKKRANKFVKTYKAKSNIAVANIFEVGTEEVTNRLLSWIEAEFSKNEFKKVLTELRALLQQLETE